MLKIMAEFKNLSRQQASEYLVVSIITIDRAIKSKKIAFYRIGRRVIFGESHLKQFLEVNEVKAKTTKQEALGLAR